MMNDEIFSFTQKLIVQVVDEKEKYIKEVIVKYAQEQSKKLGGQVDVLFIDKSVADEIIDLGVREYLKRK